MNEQTSNKKPFYKRWWFILIAVVFIMGAIGNIFESDEKKQEREQEKIAAEQENEKKEKEKEEKKKKEKEEKERKANRTIDEKLQEGNKDVDKASLEDGILVLEKEVTTFWDETSILKQDVLTMFELFPEAFEDESVNSVNVVLLTEMVDEKGNGEIETIIEFEYSKDTFDELNYEKFLYMATSETWRILNESDAYWIHPGIYKNVKDEYRNNLKHSMTKIKE